MQPRFGFLLRILSSAAGQAVTNALADLELTSAQGHIMGFVTHAPAPPCPRDIEEAFQLSHPTVSGLLSRLEKKGFIQLLPDQHDRRCKRIHILPKGLELDQTMQDAIQASEARLTQDFTEEEKAQFAAYLNRAIQNMDCSPCKRKHKEEPNT